MVLSGDALDILSEEDEDLTEEEIKQKEKELTKKFNDNINGLK
ncbi:hypothetical protein ES703_110169 [subsurface metagenome]